MSDARRYAVWPEPRSRSRSLKGSRPSVPHGTNFFTGVIHILTRARVDSYTENETTVLLRDNYHLKHYCCCCCHSTGVRCCALLMLSVSFLPARLHSTPSKDGKFCGELSEQRNFSLAGISFVSACQRGQSTEW